MRTIALLIEYDGQDFCGWQIQARGASVQGTVQAAVRRVTGEATSLHGASRTDAGVHALGQVAHFHTRTSIPAEAFGRALRGLLPPSIAVRAACEVANDFHARRDAQHKTYRYLLYLAPTACALLAGRVWHRHGALNLCAMQQAARAFVGEHDFRSWCASNDESRSKVRRIERCVVGARRAASSGVVCAGFTGRIIPIEIRGSGFLKQMVRTIVGTLVEIGEGKRDPTCIAKIFAAKDRRAAGKTAPADGLYLMQIEYPRDLFTMTS